MEPQTTLPTTSIPKYFRLDRRVVGVLATIREMMYTLIGSALVVQETWIGLGLLVFRAGLSFVIDRSVIKDPIADN